jgi:hypothetical protein
MNLFFNQADYDAYPNTPKTLGTAAALVTAGITDAGSINGTYFDAAGVMQTKSAGTAPRLNYQAGALDSMLVEPAATNLCPFSTQIGGSGWASGNGASNTFSGTAPDGVTTWSVVSFAADIASRIYNAMQTVTPAATYTISCYAQAVSGSQNFRLGYFGNNSGALVNGADLTATTTVQRFSSTFVLGGTEAGIYPYVNNSSAGLLVNANLKVWGMQVELGAVATSTILNTGASNLTRSNGAALIPTANIPSYSPSGTFVMKGYTADSANTHVFVDGGAVNTPQMWAGSSAGQSGLDGVFAFSAGAASWNNLAAHQMAFRSQASTFGLSIDGLAATGSTNTTTPATSTNLYLGSNAGATPAIGGMRRFAYSATLASNAQLAQLSAGTL